jgi:predicted phosphodiesterase
MASKKIDLTEFYRTRLRPVEIDTTDIDALCEAVMKRKPAKAVSGPEGDMAMLVLLSDWQMGKKEGGGSEAIADRICTFQDRTLVRLADLKKIGKTITTVYLVGLGDLIEQCSGHYDMQTAMTDLDRREQMRLARRLVLRFVDLLVDAGYRVVLGAVPGNHGENRNSYGRAYTTWTDNDDLAIFDGVNEVISHNKARYKNVEVPLGAIADDLTLTLNIAGINCGFAHGHMFRNGSNKNWVKTNGTIGKIESWWLGQAMGRQPISQADLLFCGHLHHFVASGATGRHIFMSPASDGGSTWYTSVTGNNYPPGMLTLLVGKGCGVLGWSDLQIL